MVLTHQMIDKSLICIHFFGNRILFKSSLELGLETRGKTCFDNSPTFNDITTNDDLTPAKRDVYIYVYSLNSQYKDPNHRDRSRFAYVLMKWMLVLSYD